MNNGATRYAVVVQSDLLPLTIWLVAPTGQAGFTRCEQSRDTGGMRSPQRRRPLRRAPTSAPAGVNLSALAATARYVGSSEHKTFPSFTGPARPRADASKCDPKLADPEELTGWLRKAIAIGSVGAP
jgi:hypothetical protein